MKDQDDCSKRLLCELNAKAATGGTLTENEELIAQVFVFKEKAFLSHVNPGFWKEQQP